VGHEPGIDPELEQLLETEYRVARLEAKWEARGAVLVVLVLVAALALALFREGVLKVDVGALHA
jgi:hypothetical protein